MLTRKGMIFVPYTQQELLPAFVDVTKIPKSVRHISVAARMIQFHSVLENNHLTDRSGCDAKTKLHFTYIIMSQSRFHKYKAMYFISFLSKFLVDILIRLK